MISAWLSLLDAMIAVALLAAGLVGAHYYAVASFVAFQMVVFSSVLGALAVLIGIFAILRTLAEQRRAGRPRAIVGTILGLLVAAPTGYVMYQALQAHYPLLNDVTTNFDNPPEFAAVGGITPDRAAAMKYDAARFKAAQLKGYGGLRPLALDEPPSTAFAKVKAVAEKMPDWEITYVDPDTHTIQGFATSQIFRFRDDFVIQVRPSPSGGSRVEMRSKSNDGVGDFGVNYKRVRGFFAQVAGQFAAAAH